MELRIFVSSLNLVIAVGYFFLLTLTCLWYIIVDRDPHGHELCNPHASPLTCSSWVGIQVQALSWSSAAVTTLCSMNGALLSRQPWFSANFKLPMSWNSLLPFLPLYKCILFIFKDFQQVVLSLEKQSIRADLIWTIWWSQIKFTAKLSSSVFCDAVVLTGICGSSAYLFSIRTGTILVLDGIRGLMGWISSFCPQSTVRNVFYVFLNTI